MASGVKLATLLVGGLVNEKHLLARMDNTVHFKANIKLMNR